MDAETNTKSTDEENVSVFKSILNTAGSPKRPWKIETLQGDPKVIVPSESMLSGNSMFSGQHESLFSGNQDHLRHSHSSETQHSNLLNVPEREEGSSTSFPRLRTSTIALQSKPFAVMGNSGDREEAAPGAYEDHLHPEDVGVSFCIRAAANFDTPKQNADSKHLHGLANVFFVPSSSVNKFGKAKSLLRTVTGALEKSLPASPRMKRRRRHKMMFSATSLIGIRTQFLLTCSSILSCLFVIASLSVEPACDEKVDGWIMYGHLANSVLYALVAIPSRCFFSRVNWRLGEELDLPFEVLWSHVKSPGLYCDVLSLGGLAAEIWHTLEDHPGRTPSLAQWCMVLQMLKSWRFLHPEDTSGVPERGFLRGLLQLLFYLICFAHCVACALVFVGNAEAANGESSWLTSQSPYGFDMTKCYIIYEEAFYFAVIGLTSIGYGDLLVTPLEHSFNSFFLLASQLFAAKVCADLTWLVSMYNQNAAEVHERQRSLVLALHKMGVPRVLAKRVLAFQRYEVTMHADNITHKAFHGLSSNLMQELRLCTFRKLVLQAPFLREQQSAVISFIADALFDAVYLPSDFIIRAGDRGRELFFVRRGEARAFLGPQAPVWGKCTEVATFTSGSYFGELAMLTGAARGSYVMATTYCICSVLPYSAVESLVEQHPEAFTSLVQTMLKMYNESGVQKLKPESSWKDVSTKLVKKFGFLNDYDAFMWFKGHDENPEAEELLAKAFDKALQRVKVPILDRRIFWSELDTDASGGISFEEFKGKMYFGAADTEDPPSPSLRATLMRRLSTQKSIKSLRRLSAASDMSLGESEPFDAGNLELLCLQVLEQNKELCQEIKKLTAPQQQQPGFSSETGLDTIRDMNSPSCSDLVTELAEVSRIPSPS